MSGRWTLAHMLYLSLLLSWDNRKGPACGGRNVGCETFQMTQEIQLPQNETIELGKKKKKKKKLSPVIHSPRTSVSIFTNFYSIHSSSMCVSYVFNYFLLEIVALQCCVSFYSTAKWISCTYTYISSFLDFLPI